MAGVAGHLGGIANGKDFPPSKFPRERYPANSTTKCFSVGSAVRGRLAAVTATPGDRSSPCGKFRRAVSGTTRDPPTHSHSPRAARGCAERRGRAAPPTLRASVVWCTKRAAGTQSRPLGKLSETSASGTGSSLFREIRAKRMGRQVPRRETVFMGTLF